MAVEPAFGARCVFVLGRHLPMSALFVEGRPAVHPIRSPDDLLHARYGGEATSSFVQEHRALLRRLGGDDPQLHVELPYAALFDALAAGEIDVVPDYGGILPAYQRAVGEDRRVRVLSYRDCGINAYGTGFVASGRALRERRDAVGEFLMVVASAYAAMRDDPETTVKAASAVLPDLDAEYALMEWREQEEPVIFEQGSRLGASDRSGWEQTITWRQEVTGTKKLPGADRLHELLRPRPGPAAYGMSDLGRSESRTNVS